MPAQEEQSLATLLDTDQRGELTVLIANTTEKMRNDILQTFEIKETPSKGAEIQEIEKKTEVLDLDSEDKENQPETTVKLSPADEANAKRLQQRREVELSANGVKELKSAAVNYFDTWRDTVILRVGEVVNSRDHAGQSKDNDHTRKVAQKSVSDDIPDNKLTNLYPPLPTPLSKLTHGERFTILNAIVLLLLSLEAYSAHSRTLLLRLASSLHISTAELTKMETDIALGLLTAASHMDGSSSTAAASKANATARKWKVGLAGVAGAALIGITGGLAAPLVAAGVGGLMGGLGLGATAAAGYLGTLAGSTVLVGGLFGAYGAKMTSSMMDQYAREVQDFAFIPVKGSEPDVDLAKAKRRLRVTIGITGWLNTKEEVVSPWLVLGDGGESFALRWELDALMKLGNALENFVSSYAWGYIKKEIIKRTAFAALWSALMLPLGLTKLATKVVDNPFSVAKARADKAGEVLADALIHKAQGERPVSLVGYSLGGRVIYSCLKALAQRKAFGIVDSVVFMGSAMPADAPDWRTLRSVVSGRLVNVYSENDYILAFLYRTSSVQYGIAGLQAVEGVTGVENVDVSNAVDGHLRYRHLVGSLLKRAGWGDVDEAEVKKEEAILRKLDAEEKRKGEVGEEKEVEGEPDERILEEEAVRMGRKHIV